MTLSKIAALGILATSLTAAANADTFVHFSLGIGPVHLAVGSTSHRVCGRPVYVAPTYVAPVYVAPRIVAPAYETVVPGYRYDLRRDFRHDFRREERHDGYRRGW